MNTSPVSVMYRSVRFCAKFESRVSTTAPAKTPPSEPMPPTTTTTSTSRVEPRLTTSGSTWARSRTSRMPPIEAMKPAKVVAAIRYPLTL